jgi:hypothetical protein
MNCINTLLDTASIYYIFILIKNEGFMLASGSRNSHIN